MATVDEVKIVVRAEVDAAIAKMTQLNTTTEKTQSVFAKMRDVMQGPVAAFNTAMRVIGQVKQISDQMEASWSAQAEASALLANVLKTTGANAWTTQERLEGIAGALQKTTKYGDETIESMQTVLLGFRNITGKEFDQATTAVLDMATVMKMDLTSAAQAVGKALDNPAQGMDSLSRQGFKFTQQEKDMMKEMQAAGNIAGAQKIILDELEKTYGGAAKEAGGLAVNLKEKLKNAIGDVNEEIGRAISSNMEPYRRAWLNMAESIGVALKAQNDFDAAMKKSNAGISSDEDKLKIAQSYLKVLEDQAATATSGGAALEEMYGSAEENKKKVEDQKAYVTWLQKEIAMRNAHKTQAEKEAADRAARDKAALEALAKIAEGEKKVQEMSIPSAEAVQMAAQMNLERQLWEQHQLSLAANQVPLNGALTEEQALLIRISELEAAAYDEAIPLYDAKIDKTVELTEEQIKLLKAQEQISFVWNSASGAFGAYASLVQNQADAELAAMEKAGATDEQIQKRKNELAEKAFNANKANSIASALINGYEAATKAYAQLGPLGGTVGATIVAALTAAQVGMIGAQTYVPMAEGGSGIVTKPTLFLAGEAGPEPYAFGGANNKLGMGGGNNYYYIAGSVIREREVGMLGANQMVKSTRGY